VKCGWRGRRRKQSGRQAAAHVSRCVCPSICSTPGTQLGGGGGVGWGGGASTQGTVPLCQWPAPWFRVPAEVCTSSCKGALTVQGRLGPFTSSPVTAPVLGSLFASHVAHPLLCRRPKVLGPSKNKVGLCVFGVWVWFGCAWVFWAAPSPDTRGLVAVCRLSALAQCCVREILACCLESVGAGWGVAVNTHLAMHRHLFYAGLPAVLSVTHHAAAPLVPASKQPAAGH
jgi:hypothetical protein